MVAPSVWNKFEGEAGACDAKWEDVVNPLENIKMSSSPVKSTIISIASVQVPWNVHFTKNTFLPFSFNAHETLASKRDAKCLKAEERQKEGMQFLIRP